MSSNEVRKTPGPGHIQNPAGSGQVPISSLGEMQAMMYELLKEWRDKRAALNKSQDALKAGSRLDRELPRPSSQELETTLVKAEEHVKTLACDMGKEESILSAMVEALLRGEKSALDHDIPAAAQLKDPNADGDLENKDTQVGDDGKDVNDA